MVPLNRSVQMSDKAGTGTGAGPVPASTTSSTEELPAGLADFVKQFKDKPSLAAALFATASLNPPPAHAEAAPPAPATKRGWNEQSMLTLHAHPDEFIASGVEFRHFTDEKDIIILQGADWVGANNSELRFGVGLKNRSDWLDTATFTLEFHLPSTQSANGWTSGAVYDDCQRACFKKAGHPGLTISGEGRGNNQNAGTFIVSQVLAAPAQDTTTTTTNSSSTKRNNKRKVREQLLCLFQVRFYQYEPSNAQRCGVWGDFRYVNWKLYEPVLKVFRATIENELKSIPAIVDCSALAIHIITEYAAEPADAPRITPAELRAGLE